MSRFLKTGILIIFLLTCPLYISAAQDNEASIERAKKILRQLDDMWRGSSSHSILTMQVKTAHYSREMRLEGWSKGKEKSLVTVLLPLKEKGPLSRLIIESTNGPTFPK